MEELIKQAFLHVEIIGPQVQSGHYDLIGPDGEIILPQVWETMIEPDWSITMTMWPMPEGPPGAPPMRPRSRTHGGGAAAAAAAALGAGRSGSAGQGAIPVPPSWPPTRGRHTPPVEVVTNGSGKPRKKSEGSSKGMFNFFAGGSKPTKSTSKGMFSQTSRHRTLIGTGKRAKK